MSIYEGTAQYKLERSIPFTIKGKTTDSTFVELREPGMEHVKEYTKLKQMIGRAQMEIAKNSKHLRDAIDEDDLQVVAGEAVKAFKDEAQTIEDEAAGIEEVLHMALLSAETVDASEFLSIFQKMACKTLRRSVCVVDGIQVMTPGLWSEMHPDDAFNMAVKWCSFFGMPLEGAGKNTQEQQPESALQVQAV